jgi:hypothetical protein
MTPENIAQAFRETYQEPASSHGGTLVLLAQKLSKLLDSENPGFDKKRFVESCFIRSEKRSDA